MGGTGRMRLLLGAVILVVALAAIYFALVPLSPPAAPSRPSPPPPAPPAVVAQDPPAPIPSVPPPIAAEDPKPIAEPPPAPSVPQKRGGSLAGRVISARDRSPIAGAAIRVYAGGSIRRMITPVASATSDGVGAFTLEGAPTDEPLEVRASARGFIRATLPATVHADGTGGGDLDLVLEPGGCIEGVVKNEAGEPLPQATVLVVRSDGWDEEDIAYLLSEPGIGMNGREPRSTVSDASGAFAIDGLPLEVPYAAAAMKKNGARSAIEWGLTPTAAEPRVHRDLQVVAGSILRVRILDPDGNPAAGAQPDLPEESYDDERWTAAGPGVFEAHVPRTAPILVQAVAKGLVFQNRRVELPASGEVVEVEFRLQPGAAMEGIVVDDLGAPYPGVVLEPNFAGERDPDDPEPMRNQRRGVSDREGRFRIDGLRPGEYSVDTRVGEDFRMDRERRIPVPSTDVRIVVPRAGSAILRLRVPAGGTPPDKVTLARVEITENGRSSSSQSAPWNQGKVRWPRLTAGRLLLTVEAKGYRTIEIEVEPAPGRELDLGERELVPGSRLSLLVLDPDGAPVAGARVLASGDSKQISMAAGLPAEAAEMLSHMDVLLGNTGKDGRCALGPLGIEEVFVRVDAKGFKPSEANARLAGDVTQLEIRLSR